MSRWPYVFFAAACFYIMIGVCWGMYMGISHDHATSPGHAHLNLLGFVSLSIMGGFYALLGKETPTWIVGANFGLMNLGVCLLAPALFLLLSQRVEPAQVVPVFMIGEVSILLGFLAFGAAVIGGLRRTGRAKAGSLKVAIA
ncbi:hypothetical protein [Caulobacter sp. NIBR1757]|uniref:hypothetical protein n=1 Tax=Caulobacter sp. NIBR1757 TaxID=3016000 RepID=UPI0022F12F1F|nr:hypothetical protein [Caulobacter sp. NIBR1757]WGM40984.1 hypothetical protein AMEJIAPC_03931 [Caulobacter sp. NIBR1757]